MDAAEMESIRQVLTAQGHFLSEQAKRTEDIQGQVQQLATNLSQVMELVAHTCCHPNPPISYLYPTSLMETQPTDPVKISITLGLLTGRTLTWVMAIWNQGGEAMSLCSKFLTLFKTV